MPSSNILRDLYEGLTSETPDGAVIPGAARSWDLSDNGLTYIFQIREGAKWSNGDAVTAKDFEFGLRRSVDPRTLSNYSQILAPIVNAKEIIAGDKPVETLGVRAIDDDTLEINLNAPTPYLLGLLTHSTTYPVHRPSVEKHGSKFSRPGNLVSNGAYQLKEWVVQSHISLVRNPMYWDDANTTINEVTYFPIDDQSAELAMFRAGELDWADDMPAKRMDWIRKNLKDELSISPYLGTYYYGFNLAKPPFKDNPALRLALSLAIDRDLITERVSGAGEIPAYSWVPPIRDYTPQPLHWINWTQAERNKEAKRFYKEAGYSLEKPLKTTLLYNTNENHKRIAVAIADMWKQNLGVEVELLNQEWKVFLDTRKKKVETEVFRAGWIGDYEDAFTFAELMHSGHGINDSGYSSKKYDHMIELAAAETNLAQRRRYLEDAEKVLMTDHPIMPIYFYVQKRLLKT
ncbi:MAG: peptide ABC transporter substrate-binding protein, partial [Gammaproteobacteria bacterium]|nr:peptide ABC transporter substrate-binding protein [Gammaproteobacteria bacterium]